MTALNTSTNDHALRNYIMGSDLPTTDSNANSMSVPKTLLEGLERVLSQRGVPALYPAIALLAKNVQSAYEAMGSIYIHPIDELIQVLSNWENVGQFSTLTQSEKVAAIARVVAKEVSLCTYAGIVRETSVRWRMHEQPFSDFKASNPPPLSALVFHSKPNPHANMLYDWLLMCATPKH
jgi:hypothetical protein